jgi:hypothetical protein
MMMANLDPQSVATYFLWNALLQYFSIIVSQ